MPAEGHGHTHLTQNSFLNKVKYLVQDKMQKLLLELSEEPKNFDSIQVQSQSFEIQLRDLIEYLNTKDFKKLCRELDDEYKYLQINIRMQNTIHFGEEELKKLNFNKPSKRTILGNWSKSGRHMEIEFQPWESTTAWVNITYTPEEMHKAV